LSIAGVHGKPICCKPKQVKAEPGRITDDSHRLHQFVVLTADIVFINSIAFLTMLSQKLQLGRAEQLPKCMAKQLNSLLTKIVRLYP
jgi:hypothetical protein